MPAAVAFSYSSAFVSDISGRSAEELPVVARFFAAGFFSPRAFRAAGVAALSAQRARRSPVAASAVSPAAWPWVFSVP